MGLGEYKGKRDFKQTAEPAGAAKSRGRKHARTDSSFKNMMPAACTTISGWKWTAF